MPRQSRTANPVNEIASITNAVGPVWAVPAYSAAGNMTTIPQPKDPTNSYTATYDAWNRLVKLEVDDGNEGLWTTQENRYDSRGFLIVRISYEPNAGITSSHIYYTTSWQMIEERLNEDADSGCHFVWGQRHIDDCVRRDDVQIHGELYPLQDANWNVDAFSNWLGSVLERYFYSAYGVPGYCNAEFDESLGGSSWDWELLYSSYYYCTFVGLFYIRRRVYFAAMGAWMQRDPLLLAADINVYRYCNNKPLDYIDPYGLFCLLDCPQPERKECEDSIATAFKEMKLENRCRGISIKPICKSDCIPDKYLPKELKGQDTSLTCVGDRAQKTGAITIFVCVYHAVNPKSGLKSNTCTEAAAAIHELTHVGHFCDELKGVGKPLSCEEREKAAYEAECKKKALLGLITDEQVNECITRGVAASCKAAAPPEKGKPSPIDRACRDLTNP